MKCNKWADSYIQPTWASEKDDLDKDRISGTSDEIVNRRIDSGSTSTAMTNFCTEIEFWCMNSEQHVGEW